MKKVIVVFIVLFCSVVFAEQSNTRRNDNSNSNFNRRHHCQRRYDRTRQREIDEEKHEAEMEYLKVATEAERQRMILDGILIENLREPTQSERREYYKRGMRYLRR